MRLGDQAWPDADDAVTASDLAIVPVGSTEQHGPHAPLGTDHLTAAAVADAGAERYDDDVAVTPVIPIGISEEHRQFTGTLWVSPDTFRAYVRETVESLLHHGWSRIVLVNGHGGNTDALNEVARRLTRRHTALVTAFTWFDEVGEHSSLMGHGGPLETALMRHAHPSLINENRIEAARAGASDRWGDWQGRVNLAVDTAEFTDNGVVGDPGDGDAAFGDELETAAATSLAALLDRMADRDLDRPAHK
ncbi:MAG: creatininase family protein [Halobacteriales archaeon]